MKVYIQLSRQYEEHLGSFEVYNILLQLIMISLRNGYAEYIEGNKK
uniref:Uncharacterized protein n=1 Tax=Aegilops tauschii subsp. strangulata TaxID=200361 RepID=A0A453QB46_AEGTS